MRKKYRAAIETAVANTADSAAATIASAVREIAAILDESNARIAADAAATQAEFRDAGGTFEEADVTAAAAGFVAEFTAREAAVEEVRQAAGQAVLEAFVAAAPGIRVADAQKAAQAAVDELDKVVLALLASDGATSAA